ncbi:MAG: amidohydrolase family protein [Candidatus Sigynarchaeota archaeon]
MNSGGIFVKYALLGNEMELAEDVYLEWDDTGRFSRIEPHNRCSEVRGALAIPAFINAHTHVADAFAKDLGINMPLAAVVAPPDGLKHRLLRSTPKERIQQAIADSLKMMRAGGIRAFADFREGGVLGVSLLDEVLDPSLPRSHVFARWIEKIDELTTITSKIAGIGISSPNEYTLEALEEVARYCKLHGLLLASHVSETPQARQKSIQNRGITDTELVLQYGVHTILVHLTCASARDIDRAIDAGAGIVLCPRSNAMLAGMTPPIDRLVEANSTFALGTDNVMVCSPDAWQEIQFAIKLFRIQAPDKPINPAFWFRTVTLHPAKALRIDQFCGSLSLGKQADMCLVAIQTWNLKPAPAVVANVLLRGGWGDVESVYYGGIPVWRQASPCR